MDWHVSLHDRNEIVLQFSMVSLDLFNIAEDLKKVSKAFLVHPKNVNGENAPSMFFEKSSNFLSFMLYSVP